MTNTHKAEDRMTALFCASITPAAPRWRSRSSNTWPATVPWPGPAAANPADEVNPSAVAEMAERMTIVFGLVASTVQRPLNMPR